jgi:hypothetical protein
MSLDPKFRGDPQVTAESPDQPREVILIFARPWHISCAGRRRNVAQVRREALINQDFLAIRFSWVRCDDFLTTPLTSREGRAYNPTTERGAALTLVKARRRFFEAPHYDE